MPLVHEAVRAELNARRRGTASTKTRGEVSGGGAKPWRQKGTGRARAGSSRSPVWTGGGVVFGPTPRHYTNKVNRKARRAALRGALSVHAGRSSLAVFDASKFSAPSTSQAVDLLDDWSQDFPTLVLLHANEADAGKSFRNIARVSVMPAEDAGVADVIGAASLLVSEAALPILVARASGVAPALEATRSEKPAAKAKRGATRVASAADTTPAAAVDDEPAAEVAADQPAPTAEVEEQEPEAAAEDETEVDG
jgi:large subunit ribosomal protein L4